MPTIKISRGHHGASTTKCADQHSRSSAEQYPHNVGRRRSPVNQPDRQVVAGCRDGACRAQAVSFERLARLISDLFGLEISEGELANMLDDSRPPLPARPA